ncbi:MAG: DNA-binding response regulator [Crocinitomicaceae bacterium]|nr:DNA-binding response regulator [Crocinitomicaceae bacterium]|tara:strand:- start:558 stop:1250 length:693 start_codon:yes stop_codon:yes gene_type:complete
MNNKIKILLVEDDQNLGSISSDYLNAKGFECIWETNGEAGYQRFLKDKFDVLIFDVMMPIKDGFSLAKDVRGVDKKTPILFLTAKSMKEDTLKGFELGADDYVTKPFNMEELIARIKAIVNRTKENINHFDDISIGSFLFNSKTQILKSKDKSIKLTTKESELLILLCKNKNDILERNFALKAVWGDDNYFNGRSMDVYIAKLRKYLKEETNIQIINVHGRGFKLLEEKA